MSAKEAVMRNFAKYILLAQTASDAGKGFISSKANNAEKALDEGYVLKDKYIAQAISAARNLRNVKVSCSYDIGMTVVMFDIRGYGQISFHSFKDWSYLNLPYGEWNGIKGGSIKTCQKLARKYNLPYYKIK